MIRSVLALALLAAVPAAAGPVRLDRDVVPVRQSVELHIDPARDAYRGRVTIELDVRRSVPSFRLHAQEISIERLALSSGAATHAAGEGDTIVVMPARPLTPGPVTLTIDFANEYDRRAVGLYKMVRGDTPYVFTQFQPIDARKAFPCFDEPGFKIPYRMTVSAPTGLLVVANTPETSKVDADGWTRWTFAPTKPLSSYLLAIAVGDLATVPLPGLGVPGRIVTVKGQEHLTGPARAVTPPLLKAAEVYFGTPYPYEKLDLIAIPEYWPGAMEHPGAITFAEGVLLLDEATATPQQRRILARITAHELAHQWFGDLVTMAWWDDMWLNETFADWLGDKLAHAVDPGLGIEISELQPVQNIMNVDARATAAPIQRPIDDPTESIRIVALAYNKGKAVLSMLERSLGEERFRDGVRRYMAKHEWGNAVTSDFMAALDAAAGPEASATLSGFIAQPGLPLVSVETLPPNRLRLRQSRFAPAGVELEALTWRIPVALRYSDGEATHEQIVVLDGAEKVLELPVKRVAWVFPQADATGYYRWTMPAAAMEALASSASAHLTPRERVALLGNAGALLDAGRLRGDEFLGIVGRLGQDPDPDVLIAALAAVGKVRGAFTTTSTRPALAAWLRRQFGPALDRVGMAPQPHEVPGATEARVDLMGWLGRHGDDPRVLAWAREAAPRVLKDPAAVHPSLAGVAVRLHAIDGDVALFDEYRRRFEAASTPADRGRWLGALGAFRRPEVRARALDYVLSGPLRPNELFAIPQGLNDTAEARDEIFAWFTANYEAIAGRTPPLFLAGLPFATVAGCEPERLTQARAFFGQEGHFVQGTAQTLERVAEQVGQCDALRRRELSSVEAYLADAS